MKAVYSIGYYVGNAFSSLMSLLCFLIFRVVAIQIVIFNIFAKIFWKIFEKVKIVVQNFSCGIAHGTDEPSFGVENLSGTDLDKIKPIDLIVCLLLGIFLYKLFKH